MDNKIFPILKFIAAAIIICGLVVFSFFSNEARKEVYYLCGNFGTGTSYSNVIRQLDTINLSEYKVVHMEQGKRVIHSSKLNFHLTSCNIDFNPQEEVVSVSYG